MIFYLIFLFTAVPIFELWLLFKAGGEIGILNTVGIVFITGVVGAALAKKQGFVLMNQVRGEMESGQVPADSLIHGFMVLAGGLLLLTPGFVTDALGFSMVLPGPRHFFVVLFKKWIVSKIAKGSVKFYTSNMSSGFSGSFGGQEPSPFEQKREVRDARVINVQDVDQDS